MLKWKMIGMCKNCSKYKLFINNIPSLDDLGVGRRWGIFPGKVRDLLHRCNNDHPVGSERERLLVATCALCADFRNDNHRVPSEYTNTKVIKSAAYISRKINLRRRIWRRAKRSCLTRPGLVNHFGPARIRRGLASIPRSSPFACAILLPTFLRC